MRGGGAMPAAALQGAAQVYSEETPAQDAIAKAARPASASAVAGTRERAPRRPHGSGPFGINLFSTERAVTLRATHLLRPSPPEVRLHFSSISCIMML